MTTYITVADVDEILGGTWAPEEKKPMAVLQANTYLTSLGLVNIDMTKIPDEVKQAGAQLALVASQGKLYEQKTEGQIESKTVKAGSVSTSKTFGSLVSTASGLPSETQFALGLLWPWLTNPFAFRVYRG